MQIAILTIKESTSIQSPHPVPNQGAGKALEASFEKYWEYHELGLVHELTFQIFQAGKEIGMPISALVNEPPPKTAPYGVLTKLN